MREKLIMDKWRPPSKTQTMSLGGWFLVWPVNIVTKVETVKTFEEPVETETIEETDEISMEFIFCAPVSEAYAESEAESLVTIQYGSECESTAPSARVYDLR